MPIRSTLLSITLLGLALPSFLAAAAETRAAPIQADAEQTGAEEAGAEEPIRQIALPRPWGRHPVGIREAVLVDSTREVLAADGRSDEDRIEVIDRPILVRLWYPAAEPAPGDSPRETRPYMHPAVAESWRSTLPVSSGWEDSVRTNAVAGAPAAVGEDPSPVLLFSHGRSWPVENYQILLEELASRGWVVVGISHPGEEALTRLPGGIEIPFAGAGWDDDAERAVVLMSAVEDMVRDARLVLDWLHATGEGETGLPGGRLDLARGVGYFGHSLGGAAAAWTQQRDERIVAAASWEGQVYRDADRPLTVTGPLLYLVGGANRAELAGRHFRGDGPTRPAIELVLHGAWHASPSDLLYIYRRYAPREWQERHRREMTAERTNQVTADYLDAFFSRYLLGEPADLLVPDEGDDPFSEWNYAEVELRTHLGDGGQWAAGAFP